MTTLTSDIPPKDYRFTVGEVLWVIKADSREHWKVGQRVVVDTNMTVDGDDEVSVTGGWGYVPRTCVSLTEPAPLDTPPSLNPTDLRMWLDAD